MVRRRSLHGRRPHFSSIAGDPEYTGTLTGKLMRVDRNNKVVLLFNTQGTLSGPGSQTFAGGESRFSGEVMRVESAGGKVKYKGGMALVLPPSGNDQLAVDFSGSKNAAGTGFSWKGAPATTNTGVFQNVTGTFTATGTFTGQHGPSVATIEIKLKANLTV